MSKGEYYEKSSCNFVNACGVDFLSDVHSKFNESATSEYRVGFVDNHWHTFGFDIYSIGFRQNGYSQLEIKK
jgi:hypothetical protein